MLSSIASFLVPKASAANPAITSDRGYWTALTPFTADISLGELIDRIITLALGLAGALAVIYLIYAGILYITAGGDPAKAEKARTGIVNAVIGIIIIVLAFVIEKTVAGLFGAGGFSR